MAQITAHHPGILDRALARTARSTTLRPTTLRHTTLGSTTLRPATPRSSTLRPAARTTAPRTMQTGVTADLVDGVHHERLRAALPVLVALALLAGVVLAGGLVLRELLDFGLWFVGQI